MSRGLAAYRKVLRSIRTTFKGDEYMMQGAVVEVRSKFKESAEEQSPETIQQRLADADEAASFLKTYVVQAQLNPRGNFEMKVEPHHAETQAEEAALRPAKS